MTSRQASFSVPAPVEALLLDRSATRSGAVIFSVPDEAEAIPRVGFTERAWAAAGTFMERILRDRCAMREALQVANGETPEPDPICKATTDGRR